MMLMIGLELEAYYSYSYLCIVRRLRFLVPAMQVCNRLVLLQLSRSCTSLLLCRIQKRAAPAPALNRLPTAPTWQHSPRPPFVSRAKTKRRNASRAKQSTAAVAGRFAIGQDHKTSRSTLDGELGSSGNTNGALTSTLNMQCNPEIGSRH